MTEIEQASGPQPFDRCEQCHAPVDRDQRYCVNCGAHQRGAADPAARYMSRVSAHPGARSPGSSSPIATTARPRRRGLLGLGTGAGLLVALVLALIPVAAAVGVEIGRSSNNEDGRLIGALERQHARVTTTLVTGSAPAAAATAATPHTAAATKRSHSAAVTTKPVARNTANGRVSKIVGAKITHVQQTQGSSVAKKIQGSTGKNYVQASNNAPSTVVVGP